MWWLWRLVRVWVAVISRHSVTPHGAITGGQPEGRHVANTTPTGQLSVRSDPQAGRHTEFSLYPVEPLAESSLTASCAASRARNASNQRRLVGDQRSDSA